MFDVTRRAAGIPATGASSRPLSEVDGVTIHHTVGPTVAELAAGNPDPTHHRRALWSFFTAKPLDAHGDHPAIKPSKGARGWADDGYHAYVDPASLTVYEARPLGRQGAHEERVNRSRLGIAVLGDADDVTDELVAKLHELSEAMRERVGVEPDAWHVTGHRDEAAPDDPTSCPGDALYAALSAVRSGGAQSPAPAPKRPQRPAPRPAPAVAGRGVTPPPFPLPGGHYFARRGAHAHRRGAGVKQAQAQLAERGWIAHRGEVGHPGYIVADGIFGEQTERVVRGFQRDKGLREDGLLGPITWRALWREPVT